MNPVILRQVEKQTLNKSCSLVSNQEMWKRNTIKCILIIVVKMYKPQLQWNSDVVQNTNKKQKTIRCKSFSSYVQLNTLQRQYIVWSNWKTIDFLFLQIFTHCEFYVCNPFPKKLCFITFPLTTLNKCL